MNILELIRKKRDGQELASEEIGYIIREFTGGNIPDYQISALLMAIYFRGMNSRETMDLTKRIMESGEILDLSEIQGVKVDKHSTGGVGDKISLILAPMVAALGIPVPMVSGRGLGHTGGTLDKLESIPGFSTNLSISKFTEIVKTVGLSIMGQSQEMTPADGRLYALRDVTGTVESIPLIVGSILGKKLAAGPDALVFDVKTGKGAFMSKLEDARTLANSLVTVSEKMGRKSVALITRMDEPLGRAIGNSIEVEESIQCLKGFGPADLMEITFALGTEMVILGGKAETPDNAKYLLEQTIINGSALKKFSNFIFAQGGNSLICHNYSLLSRSTHKKDIQSEQSGFIRSINALDIGLISVELGAGRFKKGDPVDHGAGIYLHKKTGDRVEKGEILCTFYTEKEELYSDMEERLKSCFKINSIPQGLEKIIVERITKS